MHVFVVSMKIFARICSNQRTASFLWCFPSELLIKGLSLAWDSPGRLCWMASKPQKSSYLYFSSTDWADKCTLPCLTLTNKQPWFPEFNSNSSYLQGKYFTNWAVPQPHKCLLSKLRGTVQWHKIRNHDPSVAPEREHEKPLWGGC